jgi:hypothetical protein
MNYILDDVGVGKTIVSAGFCNISPPLSLEKAFHHHAGICNTPAIHPALEIRILLKYLVPCMNTLL